MATNYEYSGLPEGYFRLLTIVNIENERITCTLENFRLDEAPEYAALSYAWGEPLTTEMIICDGKSLAVTPHLHATFQHLHALVPITKFWIDALCINQANHAEKAIQTRRMNNIYRSAQKVLVWLGKGDNNSDCAMESIEGLNRELALILQNDTPENIAFIANWLVKDTLSGTDLPATNDPVWHSLGSMYSSTWFSRLWVTQEVALARKIVVAYGKKRVDWEALTALVTRLRRANLIGLIGGNPTITSNLRRTFLSINLFSIAKNMVELKSTSLLSFVRIARGQDVTQPVDRIYGLLGLVPPAVASQVEVDYSDEAMEKWWNVYIRFSKLQLQLNATLALLSMAASQERPAGLPSWCPNFSSFPKDPFSLGGVIGYKAGFETLEDCLKPNVQISDSNKIQISGFRIDRVRLVVGSPKNCFETGHLYGPSGSSARLLDFEGRCLDISQDTYNSPNEVPEAHWRTLTADVDFFSRSPLQPNVFGEYLRAKQLWKSHRDQISPDPIDSMSASERQAYLNYYQNWEAKRTRTFFSTHGGRVGFGPCDLQAGDVICVLYGGGPLFVLRYDDGSDIATFVGDAFVYGLMDLKSISVTARETEWFTIG